MSLFTQRNAFSPVDTTHVYEDHSDAPNTLSKALLDWLIDFVFSHRRFARPRGCTTISGWYVTQILTGPHRREGLHFVFPFAQRITSSPVDTTLVYEDPSDAPNTSSKAPLARLVVFVFSHRRSTRPRGAPRAAPLLPGPRIVSVALLALVSVGAACRVVFVALLALVSVAPPLLARHSVSPPRVVYVTLRALAACVSVAPPRVASIAADIRMSSPKTAPGSPSRPQLGKPFLAQADIALAKATGSITSPKKSP